MIYAALAVFLVGLGLGITATHQFDKAEIQNLQFAIASGNARADAELKQAQAKVEAATTKADQLAYQIEESHEENLKTVRSLTDRVAAAGRMYAGRQNCKNTVPAGESAGQPKDTAEPADFSGRLAEIVRRADETAVYAQACWQFVSNNCGIQTEANNGR